MEQSPKFYVLVDFESGDVILSDSTNDSGFCYASDDGRLLAKDVKKLIAKALRKWKLNGSPKPMDDVPLYVKDGISVKKDEIN